MIASHLELHRYGTGRGSRVVTALTLLKSHLFKYQGHVSAALVLGGVDLNGPHLFTVSTLASASSCFDADLNKHVNHPWFTAYESAATA